MRILLLVGLVLFSVGFSGCSTDYYPYSGGLPIAGTGGASKVVDGIDLWIDGTPPYKFEIIGVILDARPGQGVAMLMREKQIAAKARQHGGNGVLLNFDERHYVGSVFSGRAVTTGNGVTTGSGFSLAMSRRNSKFYVIRYIK